MPLDTWVGQQRNQHSCLQWAFHRKSLRKEEKKKQPTHKTRQKVSKGWNLLCRKAVFSPNHSSISLLGDAKWRLILRVGRCHWERSRISSCWSPVAAVGSLMLHGSFFLFQIVSAQQQQHRRIAGAVTAVRYTADITKAWTPAPYEVNPGGQQVTRWQRLQRKFESWELFVLFFFSLIKVLSISIY